jgi:hypothetical protein
MFDLNYPRQSTYSQAIGNFYFFLIELEIGALPKESCLKLQKCGINIPNWYNYTKKQLSSPQKLRLLF